jgi:DNA-binding NarL/FixJ family response regulator
MTQKIRVLLVDDQALIRTGLQTLLARKPDIEVVGQASDGAEALVRIAELDPDVVLMDILMPQMDGVAATAQLAARGARAAVILLTTVRDDEQILRGIQAGARGYLLKDVDHRVLAEAIRTVASGQAMLDPAVTAQLLPLLGRMATSPTQTASSPARSAYDERLALLTERERSVLAMLAQGNTNPEIGARLALSIGTVKNHISSILSKLDVRDRTQAALIGQLHLESRE